MRYEPRHVRPISTRRFLFRLLRHAAAAFLVVLFSIAIGMAGYEYYERLPWRDAFLNSTMLLGGMGPVDAPVTPHGKLFAGCYALYAGLVFIVTAGALLLPMVHRIMHHYHWAADSGENS